MTNDQIPMTNAEAAGIGHWGLVIGHLLGPLEPSTGEH
jgi:hypothetical protein